MDRAIDAATLAALEADTSNLIIFLSLEIDLTSSPEVALRIHSGLGQITWGGYTWTGAGSLLGFDSIQETSKLAPTPFKAKLSGINSAITNIVFNTSFYRKPCKVYLGALSDGALVADPSMFWSGFIEDMPMSLGGEKGDIVELVAENELASFKRTRNVRYTDRQLQSEYAGDKGFEFLEFTATAKIIWRGKNNPMGGSGGGGTPLQNWATSVGIR